MAEQAGKVGAVYHITGDAITEELAPIGTANGSETIFYLQETVIDCEAVSQGASGSIIAGEWTREGGTGSVDVDADKKEGTYCIKNAVSAADEDAEIKLIFTPTSNQDWHDRGMLLFWLKCDKAQDAFKSAKLEIEDEDENVSYWDLVFTAGTYTRFALPLGIPTGSSPAAADLADINIIRLNFVAKIDSAPFYQEIDFIGLTPKATSQSITVKVDGSEVAKGTYQHTVSGKVTFGVAPESGEITATWSNYAIIQCGGFFSWAIDQLATPLDSTDFESGGHKEHIVGLDEWSATAEKHYLTEGDIHAWVGTIKIVKFFSDALADPQLRWEGWAAITGFHPGVAVDTIINESLDFAGTGVLSYENT